MGLVVGIARCNEPDDIWQDTLDHLAWSYTRPSTVAIVDNGDVELTHPGPRLPGIQTLVYRPPKNLGCAGSWNWLLRVAGARIVLNADTAVAEDTLGKMMDTPEPAVVLAYGFGCFRLDRAVFDAVGPFDEAFYPVYCEDVDYRHRMKLLGVTPVEWPIFPSLANPATGRTRSPAGIVHGKLEGDGYQGWTGEKQAWFRERLEANKARYVKKWGGGPYEERFTTPFGTT